MNYPNSVKVAFEYTDAHISIIDDGSRNQSIIDNCMKLCEVFEFDFKLLYQKIDTTPHLSFTVSFEYSLFTYQHYINVLQAFALEYQILIANVFES